MALSQCAVFLASAFFAGAVAVAQEVEQIDRNNEQADLLIDILGYTEAEVKELEDSNEKKKVKFSNLLIEEKRLFNRHKFNAKAFISRGNLITAYYNCLEAKRIFADDPEIQSYIGVVLLDIRLFAEAEKLYRYCLTVDPANVIHRYNLAESLFVQKKYELALKEFGYAEELSIKLKRKDLISIVRVKLLLCHLGMKREFAKTDKTKSDKHLEKYKTRLTKYTKDKYSMAYYYGMAIEAFRTENEDEAHKWRGYATKVWPAKAKHRPYVDAIVEFGLIASYYGYIAEKKLEGVSESNN